MTTTRTPVTQTPEVDAQAIEITESSVGPGHLPDPPSGDEDEDSENSEEIEVFDDFLLDTSDQEFRYSLSQRVGQLGYNLTAAGSLATALSGFFPTPMPYIFAPLLYKAGSDVLSITHDLFDTAHPVKNWHELGAGAATRRLCIKALGWTTVAIVGLTANELKGKPVSARAIGVAVPSVDDEMAMIPIVSISAVILSKGVEWGVEKIQNCLVEKVEVKLERNPELKAWQLAGGYVVQGLTITAATGTVFMYTLYAGDVRTALNTNTQMMETLAAIAFFQLWERLAYVPRPFSAIKTETPTQALVVPGPQRDELVQIYHPMTTAEIAWEAGKNSLREMLSFGSAYGMGKLYFSFIMPELNNSETFAPEQEAQMAYVDQIVGATVMVGSYYLSKVAYEAGPTIASGVTSTARKVSEWASFFRPRRNAPVEGESLLADVEQGGLRPGSSRT